MICQILVFFQCERRWKIVALFFFFTFFVYYAWFKTSWAFSVMLNMTWVNTSNIRQVEQNSVCVRTASASENLCIVQQMSFKMWTAMSGDIMALDILSSFHFFFCKISRSCSYLPFTHFPPPLILFFFFCQLLYLRPWCICDHSYSPYLMTGMYSSKN